MGEKEEPDEVSFILFVGTQEKEGQTIVVSDHKSQDSDESEDSNEMVHDDHIITHLMFDGKREWKL